MDLKSPSGVRIPSSPPSITINKSMKIKLPSELSWLCPVNVSDLIRLGGLMDGGYLVPKSVVECSNALLSLGLGDDWTFDEDWHKLKPNDTIHMYDASVGKETLSVRVNSSARNHLNLPEMYEQFFQGNRFHIKQFIGPDNFASALEQLGGKNIFIKMDIENAEYGIMDLIIEHRDSITGIAMEWHNCANRNQRWKDTVNKLQQYYDIVHVHGNNHVSSDEDGLFGCMELTHIRKDLINGSELRKQIHIPDLDYSNVHGRDDFEYYFE